MGAYARDTRTHTRVQTHKTSKHRRQPPRQQPQAGGEGQRVPRIALAQHVYERRRQTQGASAHAITRTHARAHARTQHARRARPRTHAGRRAPPTSRDTYVPRTSPVVAGARWTAPLLPRLSAMPPPQRVLRR